MSFLLTSQKERPDVKLLNKLQSFTLALITADSDLRDMAVSSVAVENPTRVIQKARKRLLF